MAGSFHGGVLYWSCRLGGGSRELKMERTTIRKKQLLNVRRTVVNHQIVEDTKNESEQGSSSWFVKTGGPRKLGDSLGSVNSGDGFIFPTRSNSSQAYPIIFEHMMA